MAGTFTIRQATPWHPLPVPRRPRQRRRPLDGRSRPEPPEAARSPPIRPDGSGPLPANCQAAYNPLATQFCRMLVARRRGHRVSLRRVRAGICGRVETTSMKWLRAALLLSGLALAASAASAYVPRDDQRRRNGTDWDPANLVQDDSLDTETKNWCTGDPANEVADGHRKGVHHQRRELPLRRLLLRQDCFASPQVNLGMAIDVNGAAGATTDGFNRKISWANVPNKPDFILRCPGRLQLRGPLLVERRRGPWVQDGSNGLGMRENTTFIEFKPRSPHSA